MLKISKDIEKSIPKADMKSFDVAVYRMLGIAVVRNVIPQHVIKEWQQSWNSFRNTRIPNLREVNPFNPVEVTEPMPSNIAFLYKNSEILEIVTKIYPNLGFFRQRFLVKDQQSRGPIFIHQDCGYNIGFLEKTSVFVPISRMDPDNGGLQFYPGTHHFGYLSDVGEINIEAIAPEWPKIWPNVRPGDIILMHGCTWHGSGPHVSGPDRIVAQLQYQPASDPSSVELLHGTDVGRVSLTDITPSMIFKRSRVTRLTELQAEVTRLKASCSEAGRSM